MSNGYGYKNQVSPANMGPQYGGYGNYPQQNFPTTLPAQAMPNAVMPSSMMPNSMMPNSMNPNSMMPASTMPKGMMPTGMMPMQTGMMPPNVPSGAFVTPQGGNIVTMPAVEESYVENILRLNRGKMATFYMTYENNREWNAKIFKGIIEAAGRDHIVISDPTTGMRYLLLTLNLDYVTFDEPIAYEYPFHGTVVSSSTPLGMATIGTANSSR